MYQSLTVSMCQGHSKLITSPGNKVISLTFILVETAKGIDAIFIDNVWRTCVIHTGACRSELPESKRVETISCRFLTSLCAELFLALPFPTVFFSRRV